MGKRRFANLAVHPKTTVDEALGQLSQEASWEEYVALVDRVYPDPVM